jgi:D-serine deaminase-like pyridoxal phosphate-dependent protein
LGPAPARLGDPLADIETPALVVDLDALDANIAAMAAQVQGSSAVLRPHGKTHKSAAIAALQLAAGAVGLCAQKVSEAEALLPSGVDDLLVTNHILGARKLGRLCDLARRVRITTLTSDVSHIGWLSEAATAHGVEIEILIEIDAGDARMGLQQPDALPDLARAVDRSPGLRLRGLQVYNGPLQHMRDHGTRRQAAHDAGDRAEQARDAIRALGLACDTVSGGGTGSFAADLERGLFTEIQAGSYVFMDEDYGRNLDAAGQPFRPFRQSLFVQTTVLRTPNADCVYVDAGVKALNLDCGMPGVHDRPGLAFTRASDEQGRIDILPGARAPELGETLLLVPSHCDPTVNQYDWMVGVRAGTVEAVWPVNGRGCLI